MSRKFHVLHPFNNFNPIPPTRQKSISTAASQHLPFWGTETKATHFIDEKVTQMHKREGEFGLTKKVPVCPTCTHMLKKSPTGITVWLKHTLGSPLLCGAVRSKRQLTDWINMPEMCRLGHPDYFPSPEHLQKSYNSHGKRQARRTENFIRSIFNGNYFLSGAGQPLKCVNLRT